MNPVLTLRRIGPITDAKIAFGDLTVLVGPQASGKSILLQWLKLVLDTGQVQDQVARYGMDWGRDESRFLDLYFGEGMQSQVCMDRLRTLGLSCGIAAIEAHRESGVSLCR